MHENVHKSTINFAWIFTSSILLHKTSTWFCLDAVGLDLNKNLTKRNYNHAANIIVKRGKNAAIFYRHKHTTT